MKLAELPQVARLPESVVETLYAAGLKTLHDVDTTPDEALLRLPGIGPALLKQIREVMYDAWWYDVRPGQQMEARNEDTQS